MGIVISFLASMVTIGLAAYFVPGVSVDGLGTLAILVIVLGLVNGILRPILQLIALPITILTLGIFALAINALLVLLVSAIVPGFQVENFLTALIFSIVLTIVNTIVGVFID